MNVIIQQVNWFGGSVDRWAVGGRWEGGWCESGRGYVAVVIVTVSESQVHFKCHCRSTHYCEILFEVRPSPEPVRGRGVSLHEQLYSYFIPIRPAKS